MREIQNRIHPGGAEGRALILEIELPGGYVLRHTFGAPETEERYRVLSDDGRTYRGSLLWQDGSWHAQARGQKVAACPCVLDAVAAIGAAWRPAVRQGTAQRVFPLVG